MLRRLKDRLGTLFALFRVLIRKEQRVYIYAIKKLNSQRIYYIGQSVDVESRFARHLQDSRRKKHNNKRLQERILTEDVFCVILARNVPRSKATSWERFFIEKYKSKYLTNIVLLNEKD